MYQSVALADWQSSVEIGAGTGQRRRSAELTRPVMSSGIDRAFEGVNKPVLLLKDYAQFGSLYEVDYSAVFGRQHEIPRRRGGRRARSEN